MTLPFPFVGRSEEQAELERLIQVAVEGRGGLVLLGGEAGTGKTTLLQSVLTAASAALSAIGRCPGPGETPPYGPWIEVVDRLRRDQGWESSPLPPPFGEATGQWSAYELSGALSHWLGRAGQPLVVVIEDLHWSDAASLELIRHMAARLQDWPVLLVATYRTDELSRQHPVWHLVPEAQRAGASRILLDRLRRVDVAELVAGALPPAMAGPDVLDLVWERTAGHALFVREVLEAAARTGQVPRPGDPLPQSLQQAVDSKLDRLPPAALAALEPAAVCGERFSFDLLSRVVEMDEDGLSEALESAIAWRVIAPRDAEGTWFAFDHALFREALLARLIGWRRRRWHIRIAEALAGSPGAEPDAIAYHLMRAGDPRAVEHLLAAGDRARRLGALAQGTERYEQALAMLPSAHPSRGELLLKLGFCLRWGDPTRADGCWQGAEASGDPPTSLWASYMRLLLAQERNDPLCRERATALLAAQEELQQHPEYQRLEIDLFGRLAGYPRAATVLVIALTLSGEPDEARAWLRELSARALPGPEPELLHTAVVLALLNGHLSEAAALCGQAAEAALALREYRGAVLYRTNQLIIRLVGDADRPDEVDILAADLRRLEEEAWQRTGYALLPRGFSMTGVYLGFRGDWQGALRHVVEAARLDPTARSGALVYYAGRMLLRLGATEEARPFVESVPPLRPTDPVAVSTNFMVLSHALRAELYLALGDAAQARVWLEAAERWPALGVAPYYRAHVRLAWAALYRQAGQLDSAWRAAVHGLMDGRAASSTTATIEAHRLLGELAAERRDEQAAQKHFQAALELAERARFPFEVAFTRLARGRALNGSLAAAADLREACGFFEQVGATPALQLARQAWSDAAGPSIDPVDASEGPPSRELLPDGLTQREVEVVVLVAAGLTNREIANRLFISPKTVDRHLRNIFNKTGVSNRAALAAYATRHGLVG